MLGHKVNNLRLFHGFHQSFQQSAVTSPQNVAWPLLPHSSVTTLLDAIQHK